jgi:hypothetical protein
MPSSDLLSTASAKERSRPKIPAGIWTLGLLDQEHENPRRKNGVALEMRYIAPVFHERLLDLLEAASG